MKRSTHLELLTLVIITGVLLLAMLLQGCGGDRKYSAVSGTVADIDRNMIVGARVWVDNGSETESLMSGVYRLTGVASGWRTIRASATIDGELWVGSTAAEVLRDEPTMNIHIVLSPISETTEIEGYVEDDQGRPVRDARVLLTTRLVYPYEDTEVYDGPYGSIVAITNDQGRFRMERVPVGLYAIISASKVGSYNHEKEMTTRQVNPLVDFYLQRSSLEYRMVAPYLDAVESYTMPDSMTRSDTEAFKAIRMLTSERYRNAVLKQKQVLTRATPAGSLIEIDLYWNALDLNDSREVAGYGIYRDTSPEGGATGSIDFVRDPYANFYGDTDIAITPYSDYYYAVTAVDVEFLDQYNDPDPNAESRKSNWVGIRPLGQLRSASPAQGMTVYGDPLFEWSPLQGAVFYKVFVYDEFPTLAPDPSREYFSAEIPPGIVTMPIWPETLNSSENMVNAPATSIRYSGPALVSGRTYYWFVMAKDETEMAVSYSQLRTFTAAR